MTTKASNDMLDNLNMLNIWRKLLSFTKTVVADQALLDIMVGHASRLEAR